MLTACGCAPGEGQPVESLPWNNTSFSSTRSAANSSTDADSETPAQADAGELQFRDRVVQECLDNLRRIASQPVVVAAVKKTNDANWRTQQQIDQTDLQWRQTQGVEDPLIQKYLKNPCADLLRQAQRSNPKYMELFVMDDKGCIVAESDKTSDFWQGDEEKWTECFNGGNGRIFVGDVQYDRSTRSYVVQISLPIYNEQHATIGAMTVSVSSGSHN